MAVGITSVLFGVFLISLGVIGIQGVGVLSLFLALPGVSVIVLGVLGIAKSRSAVREDFPSGVRGPFWFLDPIAQRKPEETTDDHSANP